MYRVIASDLDGTLLNPSHRVSETTKKTIHELLAQGKKFIIATGRHHIDVRAIKDSIGADIYLITSNGARVHNAQDELVYSQNIETKIAQQLSELGLPQGVQANIFRDDEWFINEESQDLLDFSQDSTFRYEVAELAKIDKHGIAKFFFCGPHELLLSIEKKIKTQFSKSVNTSFSLPMCLEVMDISVNKASALQAVLKLKGFTFAETIAFGDGMNDIEMLQAVDKGLIMGNASAMLTSALPNFEVIGSSGEDGVAQYIQDNILT